MVITKQIKKKVAYILTQNDIESKSRKINNLSTTVKKWVEVSFFDETQSQSVELK